jgi:hypothetical protein
MSKRGVAMRLLVLIALACAGLAVAACGGASTPPPAPGSPEKPLAAKQTRLGGAAADGRSGEASTPAAPSYGTLLEKQSRHPRSRFTPCNLVTEKQARAIVGAPMREPLEAAQGPTCIYRSRDGRSFVTLAVQSVDFARIKPRLRLPRRVTVGDRTAYCGTYGQPMLYVPLSRGRVLSVAAQCAIARRFAARAVRRL